MWWNRREVTSHHPCCKSHNGFRGLWTKYNALTLAHEAWYMRPQLPLRPPDLLPCPVTMTRRSPATSPAFDVILRPPLCWLLLFIRVITPAPFQSSSLWPHWQLTVATPRLLGHCPLSTASGRFCPGASSCWLPPVSPPKWESQESRDFSFLFFTTSCASGALPGRRSVNNRHLVNGQ